MDIGSELNLKIIHIYTLTFNIIPFGNNEMLYKYGALSSVFTIHVTGDELRWYNGLHGYWKLH